MLDWPDRLLPPHLRAPAPRSAQVGVAPVLIVLRSAADATDAPAEPRTTSATTSASPIRAMLGTERVMAPPQTPAMNPAPRDPRGLCAFAQDHVPESPTWQIST